MWMRRTSSIDIASMSAIKISLRSTRAATGAEEPSSAGHRNRASSSAIGLRLRACGRDILYGLRIQTLQKLSNAQPELISKCLINLHQGESLRQPIPQLRRITRLGGRPL